MADKKILIADDDRTITMTANMFFSGRGYSVVTANNGEDALRVFNEEKPGYILLDVVMPRKSGFEVCQNIREKDKENKIVIVIFSGKIEGVEKGFDFGADDCLTKPINWDDCVERMEELGKEKSQIV